MQTRFVESSTGSDVPSFEINHLDQPCNAIEFLDTCQELHDQALEQISNGVERHLYNEATNYARQRAELLVQASHTNLNDLALKQLDQDFGETLIQSRAWLNANHDTYSRLHGLALQVQAQEILERLIRDAYAAGEKYQSKNNFTESEFYLQLSNIQENSKLFADLVFQHLPSSNTDDSKMNFVKGINREEQLQSLLAQAFQEGTQNQLLHNLNLEHIEHKLYRELGGLNQHIPFRFLVAFHEIVESFVGKNKEEIELISNNLEKHYDFNLANGFKNIFGNRHAKSFEFLCSGDILMQKAVQLAEILSKFTTVNARSNRVVDFCLSLEGSTLNQVFEYASTILAIDHNLKIDYVIRNKLNLQCQNILTSLVGASDSSKICTQIQRMIEYANSNPLPLKFYIENLELETIEELRKSNKDYKSIILLIDNLPSSPAKDYCLARLELDEEKTTASQIACSLEYKMDWIASPFINTEKPERAEKIAIFERYYSNNTPGYFDTELKKACERDDFGVFRKIPGLVSISRYLSYPFTNSYPYVKSIIEHGKLNDAQILSFLMDGVGCDSAGIKTHVSLMTKKEFDNASEEYPNIRRVTNISKFMGKIPLFGILFYTGDLKTDILKEVSGDTYFDIKRQVDCDPNNFHSIFNSVAERVKHELGGYLLKDLHFERLLMQRPLRELLNKRFQELSEIYQTISESDFQSPSCIKNARFNYLVRSIESICDSYRITRTTLGNKVADLLSAGSALLGTLPAYVFLNLSYWYILPLAFTTCLLGRYLIQRNIIGIQGLGPQQKAIQVAKALGESSSMMTARVSFQVGKIISESISKMFFKTGYKTFFQRTVNKFQDKLLNQRKAQNLFPLKEHFSVFDKANKKIFMLDTHAHNGISDIFEKHTWNQGLEDAFSSGLYGLYVKPGRILQNKR
jgi:hypothetical protein